MLRKKISPIDRGQTQIILQKIIGEKDETRQINGFALLRWQCAERQLERRQAQRQLVQSRQCQSEPAFSSEVSDEKKLL